MDDLLSYEETVLLPNCDGNKNKSSTKNNLRDSVQTQFTDDNNNNNGWGKWSNSFHSLCCQ
jgi:hypothetical protein